MMSRWFSMSSYKSKSPVLTSFELFAGHVLQGVPQYPRYFHIEKYNIKGFNKYSLLYVPVV